MLTWISGRQRSFNCPVCRLHITDNRYYLDDEKDRYVCVGCGGKQREKEEKAVTDKKETFTCAKCKRQIVDDDYYVDDYADTLCPSCWDDKKLATRGEVKKMTTQRKSWTVPIIFLLVLALSTNIIVWLMHDKVSKQTQLQSQNSVDAAKMYFELRDLREQKKFLETQLWEHKQKWQDLSMQAGSICSYPVRFDMQFDFAYGDCKPAKKGWAWDLATRDTQDQILFWYCKAREGHPTAQLPKRQRARLFKEGDTCLLRWQRVMENKKWHMYHSRSGTQVKVSWERKPIPRPY